MSCLRGSFYDVIVDLRKDSSTYLKWCGVEISSSNRAGEGDIESINA